MSPYRVVSLHQSSLQQQLFTSEFVIYFCKYTEIVTNYVMFLHKAYSTELNVLLEALKFQATVTILV